MLTTERNKEILRKIFEIKDLENEFYKCPSYTKATLLIKEWREYLNKNIKNGGSFLIDIAARKISLYSGFVEGIVSEENVKTYIKNEMLYLNKSVNWLDRRGKNKLEKNIINDPLFL